MVYLSLVRMAFRQQLTYRVSIMAGLATNIFFGLMRAAVMLALYADKTEVNRMTVTGALTYVALTQAIIAYLDMFGSFEVINSVVNGSVANDLLKPMSFFMYWMSRDFGRALVNLLGRGVLLLFIFVLFYPISAPVSWQAWAALPVSLVLGWLISFCWRFIVNLSAFWTPDSRGIARAAYTFSQVLCGFIMPLEISPEWFRTLCMWTPFPSMLNTPMEIYLGIIHGEEIWGAFFGQLFWVAVLTVLAFLILRAGLRRLVIQGG